MRFKIAIILLYLFYTNTNNVIAKEKKLIAVLDFKPQNVLKIDADIARNTLEYNLFKEGKFKVLERKAVKMVFKELNIKDYLCKNDSCVVEVGKTLSADYVVTGSVSKIKEYNIITRVVSVKDGQIYFVYSENFKTKNELKKAVGIITDNLTTDFDLFFKGEKLDDIRKKRYKKLDAKISLIPKVNYLYPTGELSNIIRHGYGFSNEFIMTNIFINNFICGLDLGYYRFSGKVNEKDKCTYIIGLINIGYDFMVTKFIFLKPSISGGYNYIILEHDRDIGFEMDENSKKNGIEMIAKLGITAGIKFGRRLSIQAGYGYLRIFEKEEPMDFMIYNFGIIFNI